MATIKQKTTLKHQSNLGEEVDEISFSEGDEVTILKVWDDRFLCKNEDGQLFNIPKDSVQG